MKNMIAWVSWKKHVKSISELLTPWYINEVVLYFLLINLLMDTATMIRMFKYMKEHNDELAHIIAARCPNCDKMTEKESEAFCNAVVAELMHVDGLIDE